MTKEEIYRLNGADLNEKIRKILGENVNFDYIHDLNQMRKVISVIPIKDSNFEDKYIKNIKQVLQDAHDVLGEQIHEFELIQATAIQKAIALILTMEPEEKKTKMTHEKWMIMSSRERNEYILRCIGVCSCHIGWNKHDEACPIYTQGVDSYPDYDNSLDSIITLIKTKDYKFMKECVYQLRQIVDRCYDKDNPGYVCYATASQHAEAFVLTHEKN